MGTFEVYWGRIDKSRERYFPRSGSSFKKKHLSMEKKNVYLIGIGGIGVSAVARYYLWKWWEVFWSDSTDSELIHALIQEWCDIIIWKDFNRISKSLNLVIYSEAIPDSQQELSAARWLGVKTEKYNEALASIVNDTKLIAITGTHGKSTTTSLASLVLKDSPEQVNTIVGTILKEFWGKNAHFSQSDYFVIEACEYKEHFLAYRPSVAVITNIEYDHADYFKTPDDYLRAFEKFIERVVPWGFLILNGDDTNCQKLIWIRKDIQYIEVFDDRFVTSPQPSPLKGEEETATQIKKVWRFPDIKMQVPGNHILFDAKLAYIVAHMIGIDDTHIISCLEAYTWVWRRMESIWKTEHGNTLMSDYGHHPTEIRLTLEALKKWNPEKQVFTIFQPHQYSRTIELLEDFKDCFSDTDTLIIPDIYESRDSKEDMEKMNSQIFTEFIDHENKYDGKWMDNTLKLIKEYDAENPDSSIILLLGAGDIDNLRYKIKTS